jgi:hypothetical protein
VPTGENSSERTGSYKECPAIMAQILSQESLPETLRNSLEGVNIEDYTRIALAWRYNSFGHHTDPNSLCMYDITSTMAHSCAPSTVWHFGQDESFCLRARVKLRPGDEITISYLGDEDLLRSIPERHKKTDGWLFECTCDRCQAEIDLCRTFRCPTCFVGAIPMTALPQVPAGPCSTCNAHIDRTTLSQYIELEDSYMTRLGQTDQSDIEDLISIQTDSLNLFHDNHWIVYFLDTWIAEALKSRSPTELHKRVYHIQRRIQFLNRVFPTANYTTSWAYEELGDCYAALNRKREAETFFAESYWRMKILCGTDHPFSESVSAKWASVTDDTS